MRCSSWPCAGDDRGGADGRHRGERGDAVGHVAPAAIEPLEHRARRPPRSCARASRAPSRRSRRARAWAAWRSRARLSGRGCAGPHTSRRARAAPQHEPDQRGDRDVAERMQQRDERRERGARPRRDRAVSASRAAPSSASRVRAPSDHRPGDAAAPARRSRARRRSARARPASPWAASTPPNSTRARAEGRAPSSAAASGSRRGSRGDRVDDRREPVQDLRGVGEHEHDDHARAATSRTAGSGSARCGKATPSAFAEPERAREQHGQERPQPAGGGQPGAQTYVEERGRASRSRDRRCATVPRGASQIGQDDRRRAARARGRATGAGARRRTENATADGAIDHRRRQAGAAPAQTAHELARYEALFAARTRGMKSSAMREMMALTERPDVISLAGGLPDTTTFPSELYAKLMARGRARLDRAGAPIRADRRDGGDGPVHRRGDGGRGHDRSTPPR